MSETVARLRVWQCLPFCVMAWDGRGGGAHAVFRHLRRARQRIDKAVFAVELAQSPAPLFEARERSSTRAVLFAHEDSKDMDRAGRIRATCLHSCIRHVTNERATNATLRKRFGIAARNASVATRLSNDAVKASAIAVADSTTGYRNRAYLPFRAAGREDEAGTVI